jgi:hypothetical protein
MATLEDVIVEFRCKYCKKESKMTALELMEAGIEGPPYCACSDDDLDVSGCTLKLLNKVTLDEL